MKYIKENIYLYHRIIKENTQKWIECITKFKTVAQNSPLAANTAFTKSLQHEWICLQQMIGHVDEYQDLTTAISQNFTKNFVGQEITDIEHELFAPPT